MAKVPNALYRNIAEKFNRLSRAHERYRRQTDRQTTDGRAIAYSEREREFTFAKNGVIWQNSVWPYGSSLRMRKITPARNVAVNLLP